MRPTRSPFLCLLVLALATVSWSSSDALRVIESTSLTSSSSSHHLRGSEGAGEILDETPSWLPLGGRSTRRDRPIVGIVTQPVSAGSETDQDRPHTLRYEAVGKDGKEATEYIAGSYVKYAESIGARVVPLRYTWSDSELANAFKGLSGIIFAGGAADIRPEAPYYRASHTLMKLADSANDRGEAFPVLGICLGLEMMGVMAAGDNYTVLEGSGEFDAKPVSTPIDIWNTHNGLFHSARKFDVLQWRHQAVAFFRHRMGITPEVFLRDPLLPKRAKILATAKDASGKLMVAAFEATNTRKRPYFAVQFHPEKALYEWQNNETTSPVSHSWEATRLSRLIADAFGRAVHEAKRPGSRGFKGGEKEAFERDINNFPGPTYKGDAMFTNVYEWYD